VSFDGGVTFVTGSPVVPAADLEKFVSDVVEKKIVLDDWCACPGFCPHFSGSPPYDDRDGKGERCCKFERGPVDGVRVPPAALLAELAAKGITTRAQKLEWAKKTRNPWVV
jgi:hypothetical protein